MLDENVNYDQALSLAITYAAQMPNKCIAVYKYAYDDLYVVQEATEKVPQGPTVVCIAQRWDENTVQLRFSGARSEFRKI